MVGGKAMSRYGEFNLKKVQQYRREWDWMNMMGSKACIQLNARDLYSLDTVMRLTRKRSVAVQAGGNLGLFPKRLAEEFKIVYTFEPDEKLFACLEHNAPEPNIIPIMAALGCEHGTVGTACGRRDNSGRPVHEGLTYVTPEGSVPQMLVDDLELSACDLIYLDIEGYEFKALRGAEKTIERYKPTIAVELNGNIAHYGSTKQ
jgi:FkbM family methyltransferase